MASQGEHHGLGRKAPEPGAPRWPAPGSHAPEAGLNDVGKLAGFFSLLADPATMLLLEFIAVRKRTVPECAAQAGLTCRTIMPRLAVLRKLGWISQHHDFYEMTDQRVGEFVGLAQSLVANNADALMHCQHLDQTAPCG